MATPDSGESNLPNETGNEVCDIINYVAIYYEKGLHDFFFFLGGGEGMFPGTIFFIWPPIIF